MALWSDSITSALPAALLAAASLMALNCAGEDDPAGTRQPAAAGPPGQEAVAARGPSLILISLDTLRADHLGSYGYGLETSPVLDRLAAAGVRFADVLTQSTGTEVSHDSLFRGYLPTAIKGAGKSAAPLADLLRASGYATAAFVDGGFMRAKFGHATGFDLYVDSVAEPAPAGARPVADREGGGFGALLPLAEAWLAEQGQAPFFLFLHTYDIHCPYQPAPEIAALFTRGRPAPMELAGKCGVSDFQNMELSAAEIDWIRAHYDAGIRETDAMLGDFLQVLERLGRRQDTVVAVISDHGESLGEAGWVGHNRLDPPQLFVPWIMAGPGVPAGKVVQAPAQLVDVLPTLLEMLGIPAVSERSGISLWGMVQSEQPGVSARLRISEIRGARALLEGPWLLIQSLKNGRPLRLHRLPETGGLQLLMTAAGNQHDWLAAEPEVAEHLLAHWQEQAASLGSSDFPEERAVDDEKLRQELRRLGYVD